MATAGHGLDLSLSLEAYLHGVAENLMSAGVRLIPLRQHAGQQVLASLEAPVSEAVAAALETPLEVLGGAALLADITICVIDVSAGDKIPGKGDPGITRSDLLVINKTDLAPLVGTSLEVMDRDARKMRGGRPFDFARVKAGQGGPEIAAFIEKAGGLKPASETSAA